MTGKLRQIKRAGENGLNFERLDLETVRELISNPLYYIVSSTFPYRFFGHL
jgi:hypothetical protein